MERGSRVGGDNMRMVETGCFSVKTRQWKNTTPIRFQQHSPIFHKVRIPWFKAKLLPISQQISSFFFFFCWGWVPQSPDLELCTALILWGEPWTCREPPKADGFYAYIHLMGLTSHMLSQVGGNISHLSWSSGKASEWWAERAYHWLWEWEGPAQHTGRDTAEVPGHFQVSDQCTKMLARRPDVHCDFGIQRVPLDL